MEILKEHNICPNVALFLLTEDFIPRNTIDSLYPLDIHAFAVSSLVFGMSEDFEHQERVLRNAVKI